MDISPIWRNAALAKNVEYLRLYKRDGAYSACGPQGCPLE